MKAETGKLTPEALYVHDDALETLPELLRSEDQTAFGSLVVFELDETDNRGVEAYDCRHQLPLLVTELELAFGDATKCVNAFKVERVGAGHHQPAIAML